MGRVFVIGNAGFDIRLELPHVPSKGETLLGASSARMPGGKGLNQAVVAARTGADTLFCAPIGRDADGDEVARRLAEEPFARLDLHRMACLTDFSILMVLPDGDNAIASAGPCAAALSARNVAAAVETSVPGDVVLLQGNLTAQVTGVVLRAATERGATALFNPAPSWWDAAPVLRDCAVVVANRSEAEAMTGRADPAAAARILHDRGASFVIVTLGADGCLSFDGDAFGRHPAIATKAVDTTGCGDTFCGVLGAMLAEGRRREEAISLAQRAAAITASRPGAFAALPSRDELSAIGAGRSKGA